MKKKRLKNILFQTTWFWFVKPFVKTRIKKSDDQLTRLIKSYRHFEWQKRIADFYGGALNVVFGDSNMGVFSKFKHMIKFIEITFSFGVGSTRWEDWYKFFTKTKEGKKVYTWIYKLTKFEGLGGNDAIYNSMATAEEYAKRMALLFPDSFRTTIPPIREWLVNDEILKGRTPEEFQDDMNKLNVITTNVTAKDHLIKLHKLFLDSKTGEAVPKTLRPKNPVHFSDWAVDIIVKIFNKIERVI